MSIKNLSPKSFCPPQISEGVGKLCFYAIWPFGAWIYSLRSANTRSSYILFFLFSLLICWHLSPTNYNDKYDDFLGILEKYYAFHMSDDEMLKYVLSYFEFSISSPKELYESVLIWVSKKISEENYHFFFLLASIPIALCQLGSMRYITNSSKYIPGSLVGILVISLFIFPRDIITAQNPRFATGFWYCVFITISYYLGKERHPLYIFLVVLAPFFHAAFFVFVGFIIVIKCLNPFIKLNYLEKMALGSIFLSFVDAQLLEGLSFDFLPPLFSRWVTGYLSEGSYARFMGHEGASGFWWIGVLSSFLMKIGYLLMMVQIIKSKKVNVNLAFYRFIFFSFILINCIQFVPEMNTRYFCFTRVYVMIAWFILAYNERKDEWIIKLVALFNIMPAIFRYGYVFGGALSVNTPLDMFYMPLPYLLVKGFL